ncbi:MAG: ABC transporter ATP-binding protein [Leptonema illini]|uniref:ABC transporter ATP-binding protein n=1 Tax=Leptonema illini TaxID=183 RepID=A0A833H0R4_9LEPT|nr:MAG: ABC transporter ATP-binding protein [Leptonema illini]
MRPKKNPMRWNRAFILKEGRMTLFEAERIRFAHGDDRNIFKELSFRIEEGERIALIGANGSGKTTLLRLLNGLYFANAGMLRYRGEPLTRRRLGEAAFRRLFRLEVALLFQNAGTMLFHETVEADLQYSLDQLDAPGPDGLRDVCDALKITHLLKRPPYLLSEGEKKRAALACLLILKPAVLLLDEPFAGLDAETEAHLVQILSQFKGTVVLSTHRLSLIPRIADRSLSLDDAHQD